MSSHFSTCAYSKLFGTFFSSLDTGQGVTKPPEKLEYTNHARYRGTECFPVWSSDIFVNRELFENENTASQKLIPRPVILDLN